MRLSILCVAAFVGFAVAIPLFGDKDAERAGPASAEAIDLADTSFDLVTSSSSGCAESITHAAVSIVPDGESEDIEGIITFGNITVNGAVCSSGDDDEVLELYSEDVLTADVVPDGNILGLDQNASKAIFIAGVDKSKRTCGDWTDGELQAYYFTEDILLVLPSLDRAGYIDNTTVPSDKIFSGGMWMVAVPKDGPGRVCLYMEASNSIEETDEDLGASPSPEEDASDEEEPDSPTVFDEANDAAIAEEENKAAEEKKCFPAFASVQLEDGTRKTMDKLQIGDRVQVGAETFSEVFMFTHRLTSGRFDFLSIELESGDSLAVTSGHYIYVNGGLAAAKTANVDDVLELADGTQSKIVSISEVSSEGLYNPQTVHGDIVVDNIRTSTYTTAVRPDTAHTLLFPLRALFSGFSISSSSFENGAETMSRIIPSGQAVY